MKPALQSEESKVAPQARFTSKGKVSSQPHEIPSKVKVRPVPSGTGSVSKANLTKLAEVKEGGQGGKISGKEDQASSLQQQRRPLGVITDEENKLSSKKRTLQPSSPGSESQFSIGKMRKSSKAKQVDSANKQSEKDAERKKELIAKIL